MVERVLEACCVLIVEDEYSLAEELRSELTDAGAVVIGPVGNIERAIELVNGENRIDAAVLDINIRGDYVFPLADMLAERGIPIIFATGYDDLSIPSRFAHIAICVKPVRHLALIEAISAAVNA